MSASGEHLPSALLRLDPGAEGILLQDASESYPIECCGFLFGPPEPPESVLRPQLAPSQRAAAAGGDPPTTWITEAVPVRNVHAGVRERHFAIAPADWMAAERYAESHGLVLAGIYHSHPDHPAEASETDRAHALPGLAYVIVSIREGRPADLRAWTLGDDRRFRPMAVESAFSPSLDRTA